MSNESLSIKVKAITRLVKYDDSVTQEEIDNGTAIPLEVIESEEDMMMTEEQVKELGLKI